MKGSLIVISIIFALLAVNGALSVIDCLAGSPQIINYQGRLTDTGDNPLTDNYYFTFRLWSHKTSVEAQYYEWGESHGPVTVTNGLFNVILGSVNTDTLGAVFNTHSSLYMEIEVGGEILSPRVRMGSTGYALKTVVVQVVNTQTGAFSTGTTIMPYDDTIPKDTEGDEYMSLTITPTSATSKLKIDVVANVDVSADNSYATVALFQDGKTDALAAVAEYGDALSHRIRNITFTHYMTADTTSPTTFKVRIGNSESGITTFNGENSSGIFGNKMASSITITEISP